jgi:hypothetical protein
MDSGEKLMLMFDLSDILTAFASADERARRPEATERDIFLRVASRRLGAELTARVYGWTG